MSKRIKMTQELREECFESFKQALDLAKMSDGKINFTKTFDCKDDRKAVLYFTEKAWFKMTLLVQDFSSEVAWHGVAYRGDNPDEDSYYITDILVYPQEVTGSTVDTDQARYESWLLSQEDDVFNNIRMQGHSHVNMGTYPSSVDLTHQGKILEQMEDDMFYIFLIWNKRNERNIKIYDMAKNVLFENSDVSVAMINGNLGLTEFLAEAKREVVPRVYNAPKSTPAKTGNSPTTGQKPAGGTTPALPAGKERVKPQIGAGWQGANACDPYDDTDDYNYYRDYYGLD